MPTVILGKVVGPQGPKGDTGAKGDKGDNAYVHFKWATTGTPTDEQMLNTPNEYIGICSNNSPVAPTTASSYQWYKWKGDKGEGTGDMLKAVYDPTGRNTDIFGYVDNKVKTDVPAGAVFTDTITTINGKTGVITKDDIVALGILAQGTELQLGNFKLVFNEVKNSLDFEVLA